MDAAHLQPFDAAAILVSLAAILGYLNHRFLKLPSSIGLTIMGAVVGFRINFVNSNDQFLNVFDINE